MDSLDQELLAILHRPDGKELTMFVKLKPGCGAGTTIDLADVEPQKVLDESPGYYICDSKFGPRALPKHSWEPVPEARWVDVTAECSWYGEQLHHGAHPLFSNGHLSPGYRMPKVQLFEQEKQDFTDMIAHFPARYKLKDAFIIERKAT